MSESKALVPMSLNDTMTLGKVFAASKRFAEDTSAEQAVVKVLAGQELGFGPIASMTGINIIKGKVSVSANLMAQGVKRSTRYDYRVVEMTDAACEIAFYEDSQDIGHSRFTAEDATKAGTQNMKKFPRNMLFARAISNGVKWFCPDAFSTGVYTPEELGAQVDVEGEIINVTPTKVEPPAQKPAKKTTAQPVNGSRPYTPDAIKDRMTAIADLGSHDLCTQAQRQLIASKLNECFAGSDNADSKRHTVTEWLFGITTTKLLTRGHADALLKWITLDGKKDDTGDYPLHPQAAAEAAAIVKRAVIDAGQTEMDLDAETGAQ